MGVRLISVSGAVHPHITPRHTTPHHTLVSVRTDHTMVDLAATQAEKRKHDTYDLECSKHGWKLIPFAIESLGARGIEATQLLQRMASHSINKSPTDFLIHANRMLSSVLQTGNANISAQGTADLLLHAYRFNSDDRLINFNHRGPGRNQLRRTANDLKDTEIDRGLSTIVHADYRSARIGVQNSSSRNNTSNSTAPLHREQQLQQRIQPLPSPMISKNSDTMEQQRMGPFLHPQRAMMLQQQQPPVSNSVISSPTPPSSTLIPNPIPSIPPPNPIPVISQRRWSPINHVHPSRRNQITKKHQLQRKKNQQKSRRRMIHRHSSPKSHIQIPTVGGNGTSRPRTIRFRTKKEVLGHTTN